MRGVPGLMMLLLLLSDFGTECAEVKAAGNYAQITI